MLQTNCEPEKGADLRKYTVSTVLTFRQYDDEVTSHVFRRGDKLVVTKNNGCGMGIDVRRISDGRLDMVWPTEVAVSRDQTVPDGFNLDSPTDTIAAHFKEEPHAA